MLAGTQPRVIKYLERAGVDREIRAENFFWSSDRAILVAEQRFLLSDSHDAEEALDELPLTEGAAKAPGQWPIP